MLTDRAPFEYRYLSARLLAELFQHDDAARSRLQLSAGITPWIISIQATRTKLDHTNLHQLAAHSEQLVSDHTGTLANSSMAGYVRDRLELRYGIFEPHRGWTVGRVACYAGQTQDADGKPVFLALFGSSSNVVGYRDDEPRFGEMPSDMTGLYSMLDLAREPGDPEIDLDYRWDDGQLSGDDRAHAAIKFARSRARRTIGVHDFLARVYQEVEDYRYDDTFTGNVIVGTPLWIATPNGLLASCVVCVVSAHGHLPPW